MKKALFLAIVSVWFVGASAWGVPLEIRPPTSPLILDDMDGMGGMPINNGKFTLTGASKFTDLGGIITETVLLDQLDPMDDVMGNMMIPGGPALPLLNLPNDSEVVRLMGFFDATVPDKQPAFFDIWVGVRPTKIPSLFTWKLPMKTTEHAFQVTDLGRDPADLADNTNWFSDTEPVLALLANDPVLAGLTVVTLDNGMDNPWFVGITPSSVVMKDHGTGAVVVPEPSTLLLLGFGLAGLGFGRKRLFKKAGQGWGHLDQ